MPITPMVYRYLLDACSTKGDLKKAKEVLAIMRSTNVQLDGKCCLALVRTLGEKIKCYRRKETSRDALLM